MAQAPAHQFGIHRSVGTAAFSEKGSLLALAMPADDDNQTDTTRSLNTPSAPATASNSAKQSLSFSHLAQQLLIFLSTVLMAMGLIATFASLGFGVATGNWSAALNLMLGSGATALAGLLGLAGSTFLDR